MGSWKIIEILLPRICSSAEGESVMRSTVAFSSWRRICPSTMRPGRSIKRRIDSAVTLLPLPDSPTMPRTSPSARSNEAPFTACTTPRARRNSVLRSLTSSRGLFIADRRAHLPRQPVTRSARPVEPTARTSRADYGLSLSVSLRLVASFQGIHVVADVHLGEGDVQPAVDHIPALVWMHTGQPRPPDLEDNLVREEDDANVIDQDLLGVLIVLDALGHVGFDGAGVHQLVEIVALPIVPHRAPWLRLALRGRDRVEQAGEQVGRVDEVVLVRAAENLHLVIDAVLAPGGGVFVQIDLDA